MVDLTGQLPKALKQAARWQRLGASNIPAMIVHPDWTRPERVPVVIWMHGRTVNKELDPGRYLRFMRAGIGVCAVDLPGHGERYDETLQQPECALEIVLKMCAEVDEVIDALRGMDQFDDQRMGIGGMSAGGMVTIRRLCAPHPFCCASVEATSGSWNYQFQKNGFQTINAEEITANDPIAQLASWREIPLQAFHANQDEWVSVKGQEEFISSLRDRYADPELIEFVRYDKTGAPFEHAGFGRFAADAKNRQREFFVKHLISEDI